MKKNKKRKWILPVGAVCLFSIASGACAAESENMLKEAEIHVFIAASLENAFKDIIAVYQEKQPEITIVPEYFKIRLRKDMNVTYFSLRM